MSDNPAQQRLFLTGGVVVLGVLGALLFMLIGVAALSRIASLFVWQALPPARDDGLSIRYGIPGEDQVRSGIIFSAALEHFGPPRLRN